MSLLLTFKTIVTSTKTQQHPYTIKLLLANKIWVSFSDINCLSQLDFAAVPLGNKINFKLGK